MTTTKKNTFPVTSGDSVGKNKITSKPNPFKNKGKSSTTSESKEK